MNNEGFSKNPNKKSPSEVQPETVTLEPSFLETLNPFETAIITALLQAYPNAVPKTAFSNPGLAVTDIHKLNRKMSESGSQWRVMLERGEGYILFKMEP